jgi:oligoendopeptidase F
MNFTPKTSWDLSKNFYQDINDIQIGKDIEIIKSDIDTFVTKYKGKIKTLSSEDFLEYFQVDDNSDYLINKVGSYFLYLSSLDTQNQEVIKKQGEFENLLVELSNKTLFVSQEFKEIGYDRLIALSMDKKLKDYRNFFIKKAESIKYLLDEKTEFALNLKHTSGATAFENMYEELTNSFSFSVNIAGEIKTITSDEVRSLRMSPDEQVRKEATKSIREVYSAKQNQITLGNTYSAIIKDWVSETKLRGFENILSRRNLGQQIPDKAVDALLAQVESAYPLFHKYLQIKAKLMGKEKLMDWDLYAPIEKDIKDFPFEQGLELYLEKIREFDPEFYEYSKTAFEEGRVDVFPKAGKRGGAFCVYDAQFPSFVLLNYTDKLNDVSTLAHEFGHSIHAYLSRGQKPQVYYSGTSMAETASIFNETLLNNEIEKTLSDNERLGFLENQLGDIFSTIFRQVQYTLFEKRVHQAVYDGQELSYEDFNKIWREEQQKLTGGFVEYSIEGEKESGWSSIPHIFATPFYCYSYAFGNILSFALYEKYREQGQSFVEKYKNILRSGGSKPPYELLMENDLDITSADFYKAGLKVVEDLVAEFEIVSKN